MPTDITNKQTHISKQILKLLLFEFIAQQARIHLSLITFIFTIYFPCTYTYAEKTNALTAQNTNITKNIHSDFLLPGEQAWLAKHPVITLGFNPHMEPLLIRLKDGRLTGIYPTLFKDIEKILGIKFIIKLNDWKPIVAQARKREIDGLLACAPSQAKASSLLRTTPIHMSYPVIFTRNNAPFKINSIEDLKGKTVAYHQEVKMLEVVLEPYKNTAKIIPVKSTLQAMRLVLEGKADAALAVSFENYLIGKNVLTGLKLAHIDLSHKNPIATGIRSDWPELVSILNKTLTHIGHTRIQEILAEWTRTKSQQLLLNLTPKQKNWLNTHRVIRVASDSSFAPIEFADNKGIYQGIAIDYLRLVEKKLGIRFEIAKQEPWYQLIQKAKKRDLDMFSCVAKTPERSRYLSFTTPFITSPVVIFCAADTSYIGNISGLKGKKVAVVKGYAIHEILARKHPELNLVPVENISEGLKSLESGKVFAYVGNLITTSHYISQSGHNLIKVGGETPYKLALCMAARKDWPQFTEILQQALDSISPKERNTIYRKWLSITYEHGFNYSLIWKILVVAASVIAVFITWNYKLKKEVEKQTETVKIKAEALATSEKQYRLLADNAVDVIWTLDSNHKMTYISPSIEQLRGYTVKESMSQNFEDSFVPSYLKLIRHALDKVPEANHPITFEAEQTCKDGSAVWVEISINSLIDDSEQRIGFIGTSRNIMAKIKAQNDSKELEKHLRQAQKMEAIGTLAGGIAHDFNNILSGIVCGTELIQESLPADSPTNNYLKMISSASQRAKILINQILTFSRQTEQTKKVVCLKSIVNEVLKLLRPSLPSTIEIKVHLNSSANILANSTQIHQIIINLCTNAYQAMQTKGGVLGISITETTYISTDSANNQAPNKGNYLLLEISDTGNGMSKDVQQKIFEPYFTTKAIGKGTGLGLAVVHGIVSDHNGHITVDSEQGVGTTFHIYFPICDQETAPNDNQQPVNLIPGGGEHILFVDDDEIISAQLQDFFTKLNYQVSVFSNPIEAWQDFESNKDTYDLIITDMTMPHMTGLELSKKILAIKPNMPIILCSGYDELLNKESMQEAGIRKYLPKPISLRVLRQAITSIFSE